MNDLSPRPTTPDAVASLCERAADEVLLRGHTKGIAMNDAGEVCLVGALGCAAGLPLSPYTGYANLFLDPTVWKAYSLCLSQGHGWAWNDSQATTEGDVHDALLQAAKTIRNGEVDIESNFLGVSCSGAGA